MPDVGQLSLRFANGAMACVRATWCCAPLRDNQHSEFVLERGTILRTYNDRDHRVALATVLSLCAVDAQGRTVEQSALIPNAVVNSAYRWDIFHAAIRTGKMDRFLTPEQTVAGLRVVERLRAVAD
jgi:predicted dehydrogenase